MWQTPKTNWGTDLDNERGNFGDFNRVENNTQEIQTQLAIYLTPLALETSVTNRTNSDLPYADTLNRIENNIQTLRNSFGYTPQGFSLEKKNWSALIPFKYTDLNRWENNLLVLYNWVNNAIKDFEYCGSATCGQEINL